MNRGYWMDQDYPILKISVNILKVFSYIVAGLSLAGALIILFGKTPGSGKLASLGVLFMGTLYFAILYVASELIKLFLAMNEKINQLGETVQQPPKREIR